MILRLIAWSNRGAYRRLAGELILDKREHADGSYSIRKMQCDLCMGATVVSVMRMRAFKIAQHVDGSDK